MARLAQGEAEAVAEARASQLEQNLKLVAELQKHAAAFEALQAQFSSAQRQLSAQKAEGLRAAAEAQCALAEAAGAEPLAAAGGSAQEMEQEVSGAALGDCAVGLLASKESGCHTFLTRGIENAACGERLLLTLVAGYPLPPPSRWTA